MKRFFLLSLTFIFLLAACRPQGEPTASTLIPIATVPSVTETAPAVIVLQEPKDNAPIPMQTSQPLRLTFPTPGPAPVSLWRPPLYPIPWALNMEDHFYFSRPIAADVVNWPLANYRYGSFFPGTEIIHTGVDIDAPRSTPVLAAAAGKISWVGYGLYYGSKNPKDPYGLAVTIQHDFGWKNDRLYTVYAHMDRADVVPGQRVEKGQMLGIVGDTGNTTGPHLHFEVRVHKDNFFSTRNPELWLAPPQGWGVLVGTLKNTNGSILTGQEVVVTSLESGREWVVVSYGDQTIHNDDYYNENAALSDLPAGKYQVTIAYLEKNYERNIEIYPGAISYFYFKGEDGFEPLSYPPTPNPQKWVK
jgi:murein DD-endopeptidase MepM/ murein hydrolase activator NlpD